MREKKCQNESNVIANRNEKPTAGEIETKPNETRATTEAFG